MYELSGAHRECMQTQTRTFKRRICEELMPVVDYIHTKAIFSFIKNKRKADSKIFTHSRDEEEHGDLEAQRFLQTKGQRRLFLVTFSTCSSIR